MRTRWHVAVIVGVALGLAAPAHADPRAEVAAKARSAMASYDAMDYEAARRQLYQALAIAKKAKLDKDPIVARVYLDLGIAQLAGSDPEGAKVAFLSAVQIDPRIAIDPAYKSAELVRMLDEARAAAGDSGEPASDDCKSVRGLQLAAIDGAHPGVAQPVEALVGGELSPARVVVMYRPEGAIDFTEVRLTRQAGCRYTGTIPAAAMHGALVHYYVAAYDAGNKVLAARGSSGSPLALDLGAAATPGHGTAEPSHGVAEPGGGGPPPSSPEHADTPGIVGAATPGPRGAKIVIAASIGTGVGYVTGKTEGENMVQKCCLGTSPVVISPEVSYRASARLSIGAVARIG
ncbi:MAG TPA: tetratricopeptide repeat protein, partial [Kofleriaceae bacterium]